MPLKPRCRSDLFVWTLRNCGRITVSRSNAAASRVPRRRLALCANPDSGGWMSREEPNLVLEGSDHRIAGQIGRIATDESRVSVERVGGERVIVAHVVGRHQNVLADDCREVYERNAAVRPNRTVVRRGAVAVD